MIALSSAIGQTSQALSDGGWIAAGVVAAAWIGTSAMRRRSHLRLEKALLDDNTADATGLGEETSFPLIDSLASVAIRRIRIERQRQSLAQERLGEIERILRATPIAVIALDHLQRVLSANLV